MERGTCAAGLAMNAGEVIATDMTACLLEMSNILSNSFAMGHGNYSRLEQTRKHLTISSQSEGQRV